MCILKYDFSSEEDLKLADTGFFLILSWLFKSSYYCCIIKALTSIISRYDLSHSCLKAQIRVQRKSVLQFAIQTSCS